MAFIPMAKAMGLQACVSVVIGERVQFHGVKDVLRLIVRFFLRAIRYGVNRIRFPEKLQKVRDMCACLRYIFVFMWCLAFPFAHFMCGACLRRSVSVVERLRRAFSPSMCICVPFAIVRTQSLERCQTAF